MRPDLEKASQQELIAIITAQDKVINDQYTAIAEDRKLIDAYRATIDSLMVIKNAG